MLSNTGAVTLPYQLALFPRPRARSWLGFQLFDLLRKGKHIPPVATISMKHLKHGRSGKSFKQGPLIPTAGEGRLGSLSTSSTQNASSIQLKHMSLLSYVIPRLMISLVLLFETSPTTTSGYWTGSMALLQKTLVPGRVCG